MKTRIRHLPRLSDSQQKTSPSPGSLFCKGDGGTGGRCDEMSAELENWVSDQLHELVGLSEKNLVLYIIALASRVKDEAAMLAALRWDSSPPPSHSTRQPER